MGGSSALFKRGLKWRPRRLMPLVVVPVSVGKTRLLSCQRGPAASLDEFLYGRVVSGRFLLEGSARI
jgi:hypothetical protein